MMTTDKGLINIDLHGHVRGESVFIDDIVERKGTLYALAIESPVAHGRIRTMDLSHAKKAKGDTA